MHFIFAYMHYKLEQQKFKYANTYKLKYAKKMQRKQRNSKICSSRHSPRPARPSLRFSGTWTRRFVICFGSHTSMSPLHLNAKNMQKYARYVSMKFICKIWINMHPPLCWCASHGQSLLENLRQVVSSPPSWPPAHFDCRSPRSRRAPAAASLRLRRCCPGSESTIATWRRLGIQVD